MADAKSPYSEMSNYYVEVEVAESDAARRMYERSKRRESKHGDNWEKVNINDIVDEFAPGSSGVEHGVKFIFEGERYNVVTDMASGYLRVYDKELETYVDLDGNPDAKNAAHYKIKKREEM
jgi:hypothetical protein